MLLIGIHDGGKKELGQVASGIGMCKRGVVHMIATFRKLDSWLVPKYRALQYYSHNCFKIGTWFNAFITMKTAISIKSSEKKYQRNRHKARRTFDRRAY
jgi:hypothetical protein